MKIFNRALVILLYTYTASIAQEELKIESRHDSVTGHSVMLIPFNPIYYLSDADRDIAKQTNKDIDRIREEFHNRMEWYVHKALKKRYPCVSLLQHDTLAGYRKAAGELFSNAGFEYAKPLVKTPETLTDLMTSKSADKQAQDSRLATNYLNEKSGEKYMSAVIKNKKVLEDLYSKFGTDVFVFLTQMEIRTNYKSCLDIANEIYRREILMHFTVYDRNGNLMAGNFAISFFPSDSNNAYDIMSDNFPLIAEAIAGSF